jgi:hypothetical protein
LWNTRNINDPELVWNSNNHLITSVTLDELEKALKVTKKMVKAQEKITLIQNYISTHQKSLN